MTEKEKILERLFTEYYTLINMQLVETGNLLRKIDTLKKEIEKEKKNK